MEKKIGILTFHNVPNYGAVLQAFALKKYLSDTTKSTVNVIDYRCPGNSDEFLPRNYLKTASASGNAVKSFIKKICISLFAEKNYEKKYAGFEKFKEDMLDIASFEDIYDTYDYIFCGSDQIWNPEITDGFKAPYFGGDKPKSSDTKVAAFSASCGDINEYSPERKKELFKLIENMDHVGVREKSLEDELTKSGIKAINTVDPTFLLTKEEYIEAFGAEYGKKGYMLEYALRHNPVLDSVAEKVAREKGLEIKKLCGYVTHNSEDAVFDASPAEFLKLVAGADYIVTNSFHGTAFSVIFNKDFNIVLPGERKGRVVDLLSSINLENRVCSSPESCDSSAVEYNSVNQLMKTKIEESKVFINQVLSSGEGHDE